MRSKAFSFLILALLLAAVFSPPPAGRAQGVCGDTYVVLPGDTLSQIAERCGTTVQAILAINPAIQDPQNIFVGQVIRIPAIVEVTPPTVALSPVCGPSGTVLLLLSSGYPPNSTVRIAAGPKGQAPTTIGSVTSDSFGRIDTTVRIPSTAAPRTFWVIATEAGSGSATFRGVSTDIWVTAAAPDPNAAFVYTVQTGDTLARIAGKVNRTVPALLAANPQISASTPLRPGQGLNIPAQATGTPVTGLSPACGPPGVQLQATGSGFPVSTLVNLNLGFYLGDYLPAGSALVNTNQVFTATINFPLTAAADQNWVVVAQTSSAPIVRSMSNIYTVTPPVDSNAPRIHFVQSNETLTEIAIAYQRTIDSILSVNRQISNPNQLAVGQKILIPALEESVIISPATGPAFTTVEVLGFAFPPSANVDVGVGEVGGQFQFVRIVTTDSAGNLRTQAIIPGQAQPGEAWAVAVSYGIADGSLETVTSNEFRITSPGTPVQPSVTIWPLNGPPGTLLNIVGYNFPPLTAISLELVGEGAEPIPIANVWADVNGSFPADVLIPADAGDAELLTVAATVTNNPDVTASSEPFTVISAQGSRP